MEILYRSFDDMSRTIRENIHKIPHEIDVVIGVPRSGMIPAYLIGLYLNKPVMSVEAFLDAHSKGEGYIGEAGQRQAYVQQQETHSALVVDDSYRRGAAHRKVCEQLASVTDMKFIHMVIYTSPEGVEHLDFWCEVLPSRRLFEWNIFHHKALENAALDIDGVLCQDPPLDDDGEQYLAYIRHAIPRFIPSTPVSMLVTCRLEKYRPATEAWLAEQGIRYEKLVMLNLPDKATRQKWGRHGYYKGEVYAQSDCTLFIESSLREALQIAEVTRKPVFCTQTMSMIGQTRSTKTTLAYADATRRTIRRRLHKWVRPLFSFRNRRSSSIPH